MNGFHHVPCYLTDFEINDLLREIRDVVAEAPLVTPTMGNGAPFRLRVTNCGAYGWFSEAGRYGYRKIHPRTQKPWPSTPPGLSFLISRALADSGVRMEPESVLMNFYDDDGRLGLHQDRDEEDLAAPIVSFSLGDACEFLLGGPHRSDPVKSIVLREGDLLVMSGEARRYFHGVRRLLLGTARIPTRAMGAHRINLTVRQVTRRSDAPAGKLSGHRAPA